MSKDQKKMFTAELQRLRLRTPAKAAAPGDGEVLDAIAGLRRDIQELSRLMQPEQEAVVPEDSTADQALERQKAEVSILKTELRALANSIQQTKLEIAALRPHEADEDRLMAVTHELDAIVSATEGATQSILGAAEHIDALVERIQAQEKDSYLRHMADEIREHVVTVFEACNFQDITGQRITKIVNTLKFVEGRVNAMIEIWGAEAFSDLPPPVEVEADDESKLLNGPQLENKGISQDEIDKLFG